MNSRISEMEVEMQKQRTRTIDVVTEKERELEAASEEDKSFKDNIVHKRGIDIDYDPMTGYSKMVLVIDTHEKFRVITGNVSSHCSVQLKTSVLLSLRHEQICAPADPSQAGKISLSRKMSSEHQNYSDRRYSIRSRKSVDALSVNNIDSGSGMFIFMHLFVLMLISIHE
uniref:Transmembrane protein n=1 Tax=Angiostrongylus cantonensis TaxID=6313 RepID=A0A0K0D8H1_ANGCA